VSAVVVGASAGLGRALAERLAAAGHDLVLASSDPRDVDAVAADLRIRHAVRVRPVALDVGAPGLALEPLERAVDELGGLDALLLPAGWTAEADGVALDAAVAERLVRTNFLGAAAIVSALLPRLSERPRASVTGFGSIAAVRGRGTNVVYAASKRALQTYFDGLRHACAGSSVRVAFYVLGYLDTSLAFGRPTPLPRADPARLADRVVGGLGRCEGVMYHPRAWRLVAAALPLVPFAAFRHLRS
jgi:NADP-dependent 3-hydroxy acid dehydrogenase YdfG